MAWVAILPLIASAAACSDSSENVGVDASADVIGNDAKGADAAAKADGDSAVPQTPPTVILTSPVDMAKNESANTLVTATFSKPMAGPTVTAVSFTLKQGTVAVLGDVTYGNSKAVFAPKSPLSLNTLYTATVANTVTDSAGTAMVAPYTWSFTTDTVAAIGPAPVVLGTAGDYVVLAKSEVTNVPTSAVTGDVGLSPAAASFITGFAMTRVGTYWTSPQVTGNIFASDNDPPTPTNLNVAILNMETAYTDAAGRPTPKFLNLGAGDIGGKTLVPGLYNWGTGVTVPTDVTISGGANDTWIFQVAGDLKMASAKKMTLIGGARAKNIVWQVAGFVEFGTNSHAEGVVLCKTAIHLQTGSSINGRALAQTAVTLAGSTVTKPQ